MNILLCMKQVPDDSVEVTLGADGTPDIKKITQVVNAFDTYALEMAARFKEANGGEVTALSVGPDSVKNSLKNCMAVGADFSFLAEDAAFEGSDTLGIAEVLTDAVKKLEADKGAAFDVIVTGKEATDEAKGQTGITLANKLDRGVITNVIAFEAEDGKITAKQETEEGYRTVIADTPVILTISKPDYDPRYPTIKNKMAARKKPIDVIDAAAIGTDAAKCGAGNAVVTVEAIYEPPKKDSGVKVQEETDEDSALKAIALMTADKVI